MSQIMITWPVKIKPFPSASAVLSEALWSSLPWQGGDSPPGHRHTRRLVNQGKMRLVWHIGSALHARRHLSRARCSNLM